MDSSFKPELLLDRCIEVRHFCLAWGRQRKRRSIRSTEPRELKLIGRPVQLEIVPALESGLIHNRPTQGGSNWPIAPINLRNWRNLRLNNPV
jgi:hypothetical protein